MVWLLHTLHSTWQDRNESLFYHVLTENIEELLPIVHMPTVSQYCQTYGLMFKSLPRSLFISIRDRGAPQGFAGVWHRVSIGRHKYLRPLRVLWESSTGIYACSIGCFCISGAA